MQALVIPGVALLTALLIDSLWPRAPGRWHPLTGMTRYLGWIGTLIAPRESRRSPDWAAFSAGAMAWYGGAMLAVIAAILVQRALQPLAWPASALLLGLALAPWLGWRQTRDAVAAVEPALAQSLDAGRRQLGRLVAQPVMQLDANQVRETALAVLARQFQSGLVAPIFWFLLAGLPGAVLYRYAQQADLMWGHRGFRAGSNWAWSGKWAARADDVLAWLPARLTALVLGMAAGGLALGALRASAKAAPSPNSGWPASALALALGVALRRGGYTLNADGAPPDAATLPRALQLTRRATGVLILWVLLVGLVFAWSRGWL